MWCIGALTAQYRQRMYDLLALYARPFRIVVAQLDDLVGAISGELVAEARERP